VVVVVVVVLIKYRITEKTKDGEGRGCMDNVWKAGGYWTVISWLKSGDIKGETESTIMAAQDQASSTNYFKNKILKEEIDSKCRLCKQYEETIDHLTSGCSSLAKSE